MFDQHPPASYSSNQGWRLLLVFLALEAITRPLLKAGARGSGATTHFWWSLAQMIILVPLACWLAVKIARIPLSHLGLYGWGRWSSIERMFFPQILIISFIAFFFSTWTDLRTVLARPHLWQVGLFVLLPQMLWGGYQEFVYRGVLQTETVHRLGATVGILVSNLVFTFGPLHFYHLALGRKDPSHLWIFVAIFSIGLYFGVLYRRSGNLWMIMVLHGLGDFFIDGLAQVSRLPG